MHRCGCGLVPARAALAPGKMLLEYIGRFDSVFGLTLHGYIWAVGRTEETEVFASRSGSVGSVECIFGDVLCSCGLFFDVLSRDEL